MILIYYVVWRALENLELTYDLGSYQLSRINWDKRERRDDNKTV